MFRAFIYDQLVLKIVGNTGNTKVMTLGNTILSDGIKITFFSFFSVITFEFKKTERNSSDF